MADLLLTRIAGGDGAGRRRCCRPSSWCAPRLTVAGRVASTPAQAGAAPPPHRPRHRRGRQGRGRRHGEGPPEIGVEDLWRSSTRAPRPRRARYPSGTGTRPTRVTSVHCPSPGPVAQEGRGADGRATSSAGPRPPRAGGTSRAARHAALPERGREHAGRELLVGTASRAVSTAAHAPVRGRPWSSRGPGGSTPRAATRGGHVVVEPARCSVEKVIGEVPLGPHVHADRQVDARPAERRGRVQPAPGDVEAVARRQHRVDHRRSSAAAARTASRRSVHGWSRSGLGAPAAAPPVLLAGDLEDEDVVHVVVVVEAPVLRRGDVGVGLHRVAEVGGELLGRRRRPAARCGAGPAARSSRRRRRAAGPCRHSPGRRCRRPRHRRGCRSRARACGRPWPSAGTASAVPGRRRLVDGVRAEQVRRAGPVGGAGQERTATPVLGGEPRHGSTTSEAARPPPAVRRRGAPVTGGRWRRVLPRSPRASRPPPSAPPSCSPGVPSSPAPLSARPSAPSALARRLLHRRARPQAFTCSGVRRSLGGVAAAPPAPPSRRRRARRACPRRRPRCRPGPPRYRACRRRRAAARWCCRSWSTPSCRAPRGAASALIPAAGSTARGFATCARCPLVERSRALGAPPDRGAHLAGPATMGPWPSTSSCPRSGSSSPSTSRSTPFPRRPRPAPLDDDRRVLPPRLPLSSPGAR